MAGAPSEGNFIHVVFILLAALGIRRGAAAGRTVVGRTGTPAARLALAAAAGAVVLRSCVASAGRAAFLRILLTTAQELEVAGIKFKRCPGLSVVAYEGAGGYSSFGQYAPAFGQVLVRRLGVTPPDGDAEPCGFLLGLAFPIGPTSVDSHAEVANGLAAG